MLTLIYCDTRFSSYKKECFHVIKYRKYLIMLRDYYKSSNFRNIVCWDTKKKIKHTKIEWFFNSFVGKVYYFCCIKIQFYLIENSYPDPAKQNNFQKIRRLLLERFKMTAMKSHNGYKKNHANRSKRSELGVSCKGHPSWPALKIVTSGQKYFKRINQLALKIGPVAEGRVLI